MKRIRLLPGIQVIITAFFLISCAGQNGNRTVQNSGAHPNIPAGAVKWASNGAKRTESATPEEIVKLTELIDNIAELERSGLYRPGMGGIESSFREKTGDYSGAVFATFKDMFWEYGSGILDREELVRGLERVIAVKENTEMDSAAQAAKALHAFLHERWDEAEKKLNSLASEFDEPDSFISWALLSCALEKNPGDRKAASAYRSIRARYVQFPEYWYRGAKVFSGAIASQYAEYCVTLAGDGPFAAECRGIIAVFAGLRTEDGLSLKSKKEIDNTITMAVSQGNPVLLEPLIPLIALPENPFTVYAVGALKGLTSLPAFLDYFTSLAAGSKGRLAERLSYICRG